MTATVFVPAAGALAILLFVKGDGNIRLFAVAVALADLVDRKSTRLNSSHVVTPYAGSCLKKKNTTS